MKTKVYKICRDKNIDIQFYMSDYQIMERIDSNILKNIAIRDNLIYCFNYALKNNSICDCDEGIDYIRNNYQNISFRKIKRGDIVAFKDDYEYLHFAKIRKTKVKGIKNILVRGKFGQLGIYEHILKNTPTMYGHRVSFWRKKI